MPSRVRSIWATRDADGAGCKANNMAGLGTRVFSFFFLSLAVVTALPATVLIGEKEEQCFFAYAERTTKFKAEVFVFHGGSLDIGFSVRPVKKQP